MGKRGVSPAGVWARFWPKVLIGDGCWEWQAAKNTYGYGRFEHLSNAHSSTLAHRVCYELLVGAVPDGMELDHLCRNPACVRPDHLEPVTHAENMARGRFGTATHCVAGHPFDETNTYITRAGKRQCRACKQRRLQAFKESHPTYWQDWVRTRREVLA